MPGSKARCLRTARASWPGSAARLCPPRWGLGAGPVWGQGDKGVCRERGVIGGRGRGGASGRVSATVRSLFISSSFSPSPPPPLVFQTVSINKAINTQVVAVKEKHARNILLEVALKTDPEEHQLVGTEVRARHPCSAVGTGIPPLARPLQGLNSVGWQQLASEPTAHRGGRDCSSHPARSRSSPVT